MLTKRNQAKKSVINLLQFKLLVMSAAGNRVWQQASRHTLRVRHGTHCGKGREGNILSKRRKQLQIVHTM